MSSPRTRLNLTKSLGLGREPPPPPWESNPQGQERNGNWAGQRDPRSVILTSRQDRGRMAIIRRRCCDSACPSCARSVVMAQRGLMKDSRAPVCISPFGPNMNYSGRHHLVSAMPPAILCSPPAPLCRTSDPSEMAPDGPKALGGPSSCSILGRKPPSQQPSPLGRLGIRS